MAVDPFLALRTALPDDAPAIRDCVRAAYARWIPVLGREPRPMQADYARAVREHRIDLHHDAGELVGLIETVLRSDHLWIENIAVRPERQGQGLGRGLLAHAERLAETSGRPACRLLTNGAFSANVGLYRAVGYRIDLEEPFMGGTTVYMSKRL